MPSSIHRFCVWGCVLALLALTDNPNWAQDGHEKNKQDTLQQSLGPIAPFTLTDQDGNSFSSEDLRGKVWAAHFFYIACSKCNSTTSPAMSELQKLVRGKSDLVLVSISLNEDSPEDLRRYRESWGAEPGQWIFLTGSKSVIYEISRKSFYLGVEEKPEADPGSMIQHALKLAVVDREGNYQGYIDSDEPSAVPRLFFRMRQLASARYFLAACNSRLNFACAVLLVLGYVAVRHKRIDLHRVCMLLALATSAIFLASYLYYHFAVLDGQATRFPGTGGVRYVYFAILLSHTVLAAVVAPLAVTVAYLGLRNKLSGHVLLARWTLPVWLYVSVTGVVVYWMLYQLYPPC